MIVIMLIKLHKGKQRMHEVILTAWKFRYLVYTIINYCGLQFNSLT